MKNKKNGCNHVIKCSKLAVAWLSKTTKKWFGQFLSEIKGLGEIAVVIITVTKQQNKGTYRRFKSGVFAH